MTIQIKPELFKTLQRILFVAVIIFLSTFLQIYWAMGTLSDSLSSGCLNCSFFYDAFMISLLTSFFLTILFQTLFFIKNKYIKIPIEFLFLASVWIFWNYTIFLERESSWSTYLFNEEMNQTILLSFLPVLVLTFVTLFIINFKLSIKEIEIKMKNIFLLFTFAFALQSCGDKSQKATQVSNKITEPQESKQTLKRNNVIKIPTPTDKIVDEFYQAIFDNDNKKVRQMLDTKFPANYEPKNKTPLQALIWSSDNLHLTKLFVEGGAKINNTENPLTVVASEYGRLEILKYLIEKGCDIENNEAFNKAGFHQFYDGAKLLLFNGANQEKGDIRGKIWFFEQAIIKSDYEVLNKLNLTSEELNYNNCNGETALIIAVKQNNFEMVKYLLNKNADKNKPETFDCGDDINYGKTPIQIARKNNYNEIISLLE